MVALVEDNSGSSFRFSFNSPGSHNFPLGSTRTCEDVFGGSLADIDVWNFDSPRASLRKKPTVETPASTGTSKIARKRQRRTRSAVVDEKTRKVVQKSAHVARAKREKKARNQGDEANQGDAANQGDEANQENP